MSVDMKYKNRQSNIGAKEVSHNQGFEKLKRRNHAKLMRQRAYYALMVISLSVIFVLCVVGLLFRVSSVKVEGNGEYDVKKIIQVSGIDKGQNLYLIDSENVERSVSSVFPKVSAVEVVREVPNTVRLKVTVDQAKYYTEIEGQFFALSDNLRVIDRTYTKQDMTERYPGIIKLTCAKLTRVVVGSDLVFENSAYLKATKNLIAAVEASEVSDIVTSIDVSDRFNMYVVCESRLKSNVGDNDNMELKLRFMNEIVKDLGAGVHGTIDIKNVETGYVLLNSDEVYD